MAARDPADPAQGTPPPAHAAVLLHREIARTPSGTAELSVPDLAGTLDGYLHKGYDVVAAADSWVLSHSLFKQHHLVLRAPHR